MKKRKNENRIPDELELAGYVNLHLTGRARPPEKYEFYQAFHGGVYARICLGILQKCRITPDTVNLAARMYLMYRNDPIGAVILIDRTMRIKNIAAVCRGYRARLSDLNFSMN